MKSFDEIIKHVLEHEGGYVNDPKDLGGETKYGITKRFYPDIDIKNLTIEEAKEIYKKDVTIQSLDPTGGVIEEWLLKGAFIVTANFGTLDWSASEFVEIALTLRYDYAILQF